MNIELGGGESPMEGYTNIDAYPRPQVDIIHDVTELWPLESNSVEKIYSREFMEHVSSEDIKKVLSEAYRVLKSGGKFSFSCPDFEGIAKNIFTANEREVAYMKRGIFGDGSMEFDFHRNVIWFDSIKDLMEKTGFKNIKRFPFEIPEHLKEFNPDFIQSVKLCVEGFKP